jgi:hypothetical protein
MKNDKHESGDAMRKIFSVIVSAVLAGCAVTPPIAKVSQSQSQFDNAVFKGETIELAEGDMGLERYRVFSQGATGFVPLSAVRWDVEDQANRFCGQQDKKAKILQERRSVPPHILGNFPRSEIVFVCLDLPARIVGEDVRYSKLRELKKMLDDGVVTQVEFDSEKAKILAEK